eukprot:2640306-Rhodomonas_salina.1
MGGRICSDGYVMSGNRCRHCGSSQDVREQRLVVGCVAGLIFLAVFARVVLQPAIYGNSLELNDAHCLSSCLTNVLGV